MDSMNKLAVFLSNTFWLDITSGILRRAWKSDGSTECPTLQP